MSDENEGGSPILTPRPKPQPESLLDEKHKVAGVMCPLSIVHTPMQTRNPITGEGALAISYSARTCQKNCALFVPEVAHDNGGYCSLSKIGQ